MTGLELLRDPGTTAEQAADIIAEHCPPIVPENCDKIACRDCWLAWLTTGEAAKETEPPDERTAPDEEGLHPNLIERIHKEQRERYAAQQDATRMVAAIYQAIVLCEESDITAEQRFLLLRALPKVYRQIGNTPDKLGRAHFAAMDKVLELFPPELFS